MLGAGSTTNPFKDLTGGTRNRNWDDERRFGELEQDGVVAEVLFPNTIPPFFPTGAVVARPPAPDDYELRLAGVRAHNRWLADWCAGHSDRRAGIGQIFLNDSTTPSRTSAGATITACAEACSSSPCRTT